jgi:hypothetical protein
MTLAGRWLTCCAAEKPENGHEPDFVCQQSGLEFSAMDFFEHRADTVDSVILDEIMYLRENTGSIHVAAAASAGKRATSKFTDEAVPQETVPAKIDNAIDRVCPSQAVRNAAFERRKLIDKVMKNPIGESGFEAESDRVCNFRDVGEFCACNDGLDHLVSFGDVLCIKGDGRLARIGETGGFAGHVLLVIGQAACFYKHTVEALPFQCIWPKSNVDCIWAVPCIESTRDVTGLSEAELLLYVDLRGHIYVLGEIALDGTLTEFDVSEEVGIWRCPSELRELAHEGLMARALADVKSYGASWSWATAVRAFLLQGELTMPTTCASDHAPSGEPKTTLNEIQSCWSAEPICTTVIIAFWQRYLCYLANHEAQFNGNALMMIFQYMPLKADRCLPGELVSALRSHKWENLTQVPPFSGQRFVL